MLAVKSIPSLLRGTQRICRAFSSLRPSPITSRWESPSGPAEAPRGPRGTASLGCRYIYIMVADWIMQCHFNNINRLRIAPGRLFKINLWPRSLIPEGIFFQLGRTRRLKLLVGRLVCFLHLSLKVWIPSRVSTPLWGLLSGQIFWTTLICWIRQNSEDRMLKTVAPTPQACHSRVPYSALYSGACHPQVLPSWLLVLPVPSLSQSA